MGSGELIIYLFRSQDAAAVIEALLGAVFLDDDWSLVATEAVFRRVCLPFISMFIGAWDRQRLSWIPLKTKGLAYLKTASKCEQVSCYSQPSETKFYRYNGMSTRQPCLI